MHIHKGGGSYMCREAKKKFIAPDSFSHHYTNCNVRTWDKYQDAKIQNYYLTNNVIDENINFVSNEWLPLLSPLHGPIVLMTILRNPIQQMISNLRMIKRFMWNLTIANMTDQEYLDNGNFNILPMARIAGVNKDAPEQEIYNQALRNIENFNFVAILEYPETAYAMGNFLNMSLELRCTNYSYDLEKNWQKYKYNVMFYDYVVQRAFRVLNKKAPTSIQSKLPSYIQAESGYKIKTINYTNPGFDNVNWLHIPKTGTTFINAVVSIACNYFDTNTTCINDYGKWPTEYCRFNNAYIVNNVGDWHVPLNQGIYSLGKNSFITMLRDPIAYKLSFFRDKIENEDKYGGGARMYEAYRRNITLAWERMGSVQVGFLIGKHPLSFIATEQDIQNAKHRLLNNFVFFGITNEWNNSMKLLEATFGVKLTSCSYKMFNAHDRAAKSDWNYSITIPDSFMTRRNDADTILYDYALNIFHARLNSYVPRQLPPPPSLSPYQPPPPSLSPYQPPPPPSPHSPPIQAISNTLPKHPPQRPPYESPFNPQTKLQGNYNSLFKYKFSVISNICFIFLLKITSQNL
jgi:hypothetical protein